MAGKHSTTEGELHFRSEGGARASGVAGVGPPVETEKCTQVVTRHAFAFQSAD